MSLSQPTPGAWPLPVMGKDALLSGASRVPQTLFFIRLRLLLLLGLRAICLHPGLMAATVAAIDCLVRGGDVALVVRRAAAPLASGALGHAGVCIF